MAKSVHLTHTDIKTDSRILKEMDALAKNGYKVDGLGVALEEGAVPTNSNCNVGIETLRLHSRHLTFLPRILRHAFSMCELLIKMVPRAILLKPDVVHCHDTLVLPIGVMVTLLTKARLIYDAHELESDRNGLTAIQSRTTLWVEKLFWRHIDALIVVSPSIQRWYFEKLGPKNSAVILNSPLYENKLFIESEYLRKKFDIPDDFLVFIYVGILAKGRGLELITKAFSHPDVKSHVIFMGYGPLLDHLEHLTKKHDTFHLHPAVPHSQVVPIVSSADFGLCLIENVSLSDYYCLPNKLFEYCFAGVPVLASNFPDIRAMAEEHSMGECCDLQPEAVIDAIKRIECRNYDFQFKNLNLLSWQAQEIKLLDLYKRIIN